MSQTTPDISQNTARDFTSKTAPYSGAHLTIHLGAIVHNWQQFQTFGPNTEAAAVVKADSYGLGAGLIAEALQKAGCRTFFVATLDEGIHLRDTIPEREIFVFQGLLAGHEPYFIEYGLTPCLNSLAQVRRWQAAAKPLGRPVPAALHLDTGMSRLGFDQADTETLLGDWTVLDGLDLRLILSHLACADDPNHPQNAQQLALFQHAKTLLPEVRFSLSNSEGAFLGSDYLFDMIRPGIGLYGGLTSSHPTAGFQNVVTLEAALLQVRSVPKGQPVGYGASFITSRNSRLATIDVGYADGFFRYLSNQTHVICAGYKVPVVGRVSMDTVIVDVTDLPDGLLQQQSHMTILDSTRTMETLAQDAKTISYEVLTSLGRRYRRVYHPAP